jgi:hypothetical protein
MATAATIALTRARERVRGYPPRGRLRMPLARFGGTDARDESGAVRFDA